MMNAGDDLTRQAVLAGPGATIALGALAPRPEISRIQRESKVSAPYVTHDQTEALSMSDRVIVMEAGRIVQAGAPLELYQQPVKRFVDDFISGANLLHVQRVGRQCQLENGASIEVDPITDRDDGRSKIAVDDTPQTEARSLHA